MILDLQTMLSGAVNSAGVTTGDAITATAISANVLDLRNSSLALADESVSNVNEYLVILCTVAAAGGDAAKTLTVTLESSAAVGLTSSTVHWTSPAYTGAQLVAGFVLGRFILPSGDYKRYLGLRYTVSAGFTAFNIVAFLTPDAQRNVIYPIGYTIDV